MKFQLGKKKKDKNLFKPKKKKYSYTNKQNIVNILVLCIFYIKILLNKYMNNIYIYIMSWIQIIPSIILSNVTPLNNLL